MADTIDYCKQCFHTEMDHVWSSSGIIPKDAHCGVEGCECSKYTYGETRVTSSTGASKGTKDARYDLIPIPALDALARLYGFGAKKYSEHNWRLGYDWSKSYAAAQRHMNAFWQGENIDPETQVPHVINAAFHMFALATYLEEHPEFDDRFETREVPEPSFQDIVGSAFDQMAKQMGIKDVSLVLSTDQSDNIEAAAQWLAEQPEGKTITFDEGVFSPEEIAQVFSRADEIQKNV